MMDNRDIHDIEELLNKLETRLAKLGPVAVAVSGGVDSMTLAVVANRLGGNGVNVNRVNANRADINKNSTQTEIYHAVSPAVSIAATERVKSYSAREKWQLNIVDAHEMEDEQYRNNPVNRCYFCKSNLYATIGAMTKSLKSTVTIVSGTNVDDLSDFRPGLIAATEHNIVHPFVDVGIDKQSIRAIAKYLKLYDLHDIPASPCLSSRITTGIAIDENLLPVIDRIESAIWQQYGDDLSLSTVRCRILSDKVTIQLSGAVNFEQDDFVFPIKTLTKNLFENAGFGQYKNINVEPYVKGSAFLTSKIPSISL